MADEKTRNALKEYFTACFLAVTSSLLSLVKSDNGTGGGLWLIGVAALGMAIVMYVQTKPKEGSDDSGVPVPLPRLRKMALLWYILSIVLGGAFAKELVVAMKTANTAQWLLGTAGLGVCLFAVFRIFVILGQARQERRS